ncbi:sensor histidine kinase [Nocardioides houyundeii]|uniref:sensor histidine kinase n=1 Tax=Nocardioides houyundeii TaxID=2045452 RepID=UPI000C7616D9|nr:HAMP domain-containing sensor histidine kinase [Nocardioides houyundeii]
MKGSGLTLVPESIDAETTDPRVAAVLEVLAGSPAGDVAQRAGVDVAVLHRWLHAFVDAGTAAVTNRPAPDVAAQRDRFLTAFAHELRTPLTVAQGWVALLADEDLPAGTERTVARLADALKRLAQRVLDMELLGAASLGRLRTSPRRVALADCLIGLPGLDAHDVLGLGPDTEVHADPALLSLVLRDLLTSARLPPAPRSVRLEALAVPGWVEVRVVRDADPIAPPVLQALFDPFDVNDDATGVTIGLYLARALVVAQGGTLGVDQDEAGAAFWVRVPSAADRAAADPRRDPMMFDDDGETR